MKEQLSYVLSIRHFLKFGVHGDKQLTFCDYSLAKLNPFLLKTLGSEPMSSAVLFPFGVS